MTTAILVMVTESVPAGRSVSVVRCVRVVRCVSVVRREAEWQGQTQQV